MLYCQTQFWRAIKIVKSAIKTDNGNGQGARCCWEVMKTFNFIGYLQIEIYNWVPKLSKLSYAVPMHLLRVYCHLSCHLLGYLQSIEEIR